MIFHEFENQMYNVTCRVTWLALDNMFLRLFHAYLEDVLTIGMFLFSGKIFNGNFVNLSNSHLHINLRGKPTIIMQDLLVL